MKIHEEAETREHFRDKCRCGHEKRLHGRITGYCWGDDPESDDPCYCDKFEHGAARAWTAFCRGFVRGWLIGAAVALAILAVIWGWL